MSKEGYLILGRKAGEIIDIGDDISIVVVRVGGDSVRLGISAPKNVRVLRRELSTGIRESAGEVSDSAGGMVVQ